jgi:hypothetical protein
MAVAAGSPSKVAAACLDRGFCLGPISVYPSSADMSGSTSSGRGLNCETDVMGHQNPLPPLFH